MATFNPGGMSIPIAHNTQPSGSRGIVPGINFGAIWDKFVNGNPAADIFPDYNVFHNNPAPAAQATTGTTRNDPTPASGPYTGGGVSYASGNAGPAYDPNTLAQFDSAISTANNALGRLPGQLDIARGNINSQYGTNKNELDSTKNQAQHSYTTSTQQNQQNYRTDKNAIADKSSLGLQGLLRMLGAYGAGGSSDARFVAPQAVATQASQERAGAGQNYAENQSGLDTNWNNFLSQDENSRRKLEDWRTQQLNSAEAQSQTARQDLLSKLADLVGQRAAVTGGSFRSAAQPYVDQANALSANIDNLARLNPTYTGVTPVYNAPNLSDYTLSQGGGATMANNAVEQQAAPYLSLLLGQRDKNKVGA